MSHLKKMALAAAIIAPIFAITHSAFAVHKAYAVYSPSCPQDKVIEIAGNALINISRVKFAEGLYSFNVTIDTEKMTYKDLIKKMEMGGCYVE